MIIISKNIKLSPKEIIKIDNVDEVVIIDTSEGIDDLPLMLEIKCNLKEYINT